MTLTAETKRRALVFQLAVRGSFGSGKSDWIRVSRSLSSLIP